VTTVVVAVGAFVAGAGPAWSGQAPTVFSGIAAADVVRVNVSVPDYLLVEDLADGGGPTAQAVLDSLGTSQGFASFPYPGEVGVAASGLASNITGLVLPTYPFVASSDHPTRPERTIDQPGYHLHSRSDDVGSEATASLGEATAQGATEGGSFATASVSLVDEERVVARSESRGDLVAGAVGLYGIESVAEVTQLGDGTFERSSSLSIGRLEVGGVRLGLTERGLELVGSPLGPLGALQGANQKLEIGDVTIELLPGEQTDSSVVSAGLRISTTQFVESVGRSVDVSYTFGQARAMLDSSTFDRPPLVDLPSLDVPPGGLDGLPVASPSVALGGVAPSLGAPAATPAAAPATTPVAYRRGIPVLASSWTFFPILLLAGAVVLSGLARTRPRMEDSSWSS
jgi:hypothetical protein